jgi:ribose transport system permease protein
MALMADSRILDWRALLRRHAALVALAVLVLLVGLKEPGFFRFDTLMVLVSDTTTLFLMAAGATLVIMLGSIDLSIQSVASLASVIVAVMLPRWGWIAVLAALLAGPACGLAAGLAHTRLRIPSFIATLAVSGIVLSLSFWASNEASVAIQKSGRDAWLGWATGQSLGIRHEVFVGMAVLVVLVCVQRMTVFGRLVESVGHAEHAAYASGIRVERVKLGAFALSGLMAALAGVVFSARMASGSPTLADEFLLPSIAAIVVGGTALTGGVGGIWQTYVGALIVSVLRVGMTFVGVSVFAQQIVFGIVLVLAVAFTIDRSRVRVVK